MNNPYSTLGVAKGATADTIKRAYKEKAKEHHPDRGGDANKFAEISNAYDILKDPSKRAYYDHTGSTDQQRAAGASLPNRLATQRSRPFAFPR